MEYGEEIFDAIQIKFAATVDECLAEDYHPRDVLYSSLRFLAAQALKMAPDHESANELIKLALVDAGEFVGGD
jgi:hypothetical protein